ncbi:MAG: hypothetical protein AAF992_24870 [Bacteroidota bacterium]
MADFLHEDEKFRQMMQKSKLTMPFQDFEDRIMQKIEDSTQAKSAVLKDIRISLLFFILGTGYGIAISLFLPEILSGIVGIPVEKVLLVFRVTFVLLVLFLFERLLKLLKKYGLV